MLMFNVTVISIMILAQTYLPYRHSIFHALGEGNQNIHKNYNLSQQILLHFGTGNCWI